MPITFSALYLHNPIRISGSTERVEAEGVLALNLYLNNIHNQRLDSLNHGNFQHFWLIWTNLDSSLVFSILKKFKPNGIYNNLQKGILWINLLSLLLLYFSVFFYVYMQMKVGVKFPHAILEGTRLQYNKIISWTSWW